MPDKSSVCRAAFSLRRRPVSFWLLVGCVGFFVSCGKPVPNSSPPKKESVLRLEKEPSPRKDASLRELLDDAEDVAAAEVIIADQVLQTKDMELPNLLESIRSLPDEVEKASLLAAFYRELDLRPDVVRLPLMLELAREPAADESLRVSLMAELGSILKADHGQAWDVWAQTLEAHLKNAHGLLDLRENEP